MTLAAIIAAHSANLPHPTRQGVARKPLVRLVPHLPHLPHRKNRPLSYGRKPYPIPSSRARQPMP